MKSDREDGEIKTPRRQTSAILRRNSINSETNSVASSRTQSTLLGSTSDETAKKTEKIQNPNFCVTGKQFLRKSKRASSTGASGCRKDVLDSKERMKGGSLSQSYPQAHCTEMSDMDISEISVDTNDTLASLRNKRESLKKKMPIVATSTPRNLPKVCQKPRSASVQAVRNTFNIREPGKFEESAGSCESSRSVVSCSNDSFIKASTTDTCRSDRSTELENSSVSPECSSRSSCQMSPRTGWWSWIETNTDISQKREDLNVDDWKEFWESYNSSLHKVPLEKYYELCPTPTRSENNENADLDILNEETLQKESPKNIESLKEIITNYGLQLTPRETQSLIKCTHILSRVLTNALERNAKQEINAKEEGTFSKCCSKNKTIPEPNVAYLSKKANLTLDLKEQVEAMQVKPLIEYETLGTQTDISLPNTKSAPRIFESILRQLSRTSIDEQVIKKTEESIEIPVKICEGNESKSSTNDIEKGFENSEKSVTPSSL